MGPTKATGTALAVYMQSLVYTLKTQNATSPLLGMPIFALAQLEEIKNVQTVLASGNAACEVMGWRDSSKVATFAGSGAGKRFRTQSWIICSMVGIDTSDQAAQIYDISDEIITALSPKIQLDSQVAGLFWARFKDPDAGQFMRIERNGQEVQAHVIEVVTDISEDVGGLS